MSLESNNGVTFYVPCLNEEGNIGQVLDTLIHIMEKRSGTYEIIVVDDHSSDGTVTEVLDHCQRYPDKPIGLIKNAERKGIGYNYFQAASKAKEAFYMLICGDASEPPETIAAILSLKGQADAIVPYFGSKDSRRWTRRFLSNAFVALINAVSGHRLRYYNGPVLHKTENVLRWHSNTTSGFGYQAELLCRLLDEGLFVREIQVANNDRVRGSTKAFAPGNILLIFQTILRLAYRHLKHKFAHD